jgi:hypothetical protein
MYGGIWYYLEYPNQIYTARGGGSLVNIFVTWMGYMTQIPLKNTGKASSKFFKDVYELRIWPRERTTQRREQRTA